MTPTVTVSAGPAAGEPARSEVDDGESAAALLLDVVIAACGGDQGETENRDGDSERPPRRVDVAWTFTLHRCPLVKLSDVLPLLRQDPSTNTFSSDSPNRLTSQGYSHMLSSASPFFPS